MASPRKHTIKVLFFCADSQRGGKNGRHISWSEKTLPQSLSKHWVHLCFLKWWKELIFDFCPVSRHHQQVDGAEASPGAEELLLRTHPGGGVSGHYPRKGRGTDWPVTLLSPGTWALTSKEMVLSHPAGETTGTTYLFPSLPLTLPRENEIEQRSKENVDRFYYQLRMSDLWPMASGKNNWNQEEIRCTGVPFIHQILCPRHRGEEVHTLKGIPWYSLRESTTK